MLMSYNTCVIMNVGISKLKCVHAEHLNYYSARTETKDWIARGGWLNLAMLPILVVLLDEFTF